MAKFMKTIFNSFVIYFTVHINHDRSINSGNTIQTTQHLHLDDLFTSTSILVALHRSTYESQFPSHINTLKL